MPMDSNTCEALDRLDAKHEAATDSQTKHAISNEALDLLAAKSDPKPPSRG